MSKIITLPGLIDPHVHLRDPGQTHKEDFYTGTSAALAGGYVALVDMPNNLKHVSTPELLDEKINLARQKAVCDIGFTFGTLGTNLDLFEEIYEKVVGLKIYLNITTGGYKISTSDLGNIYKSWQSDKPIFLHAEEDVSRPVLETLLKYPRRTHICHISSADELKWIMQAKSEGLPITCGVTPHHLFLSHDDWQKLKGFGFMKPELKPKADQDFFWQNIDSIDMIESDHAPHTKKEKMSSAPPFGVPGLETTLPLLLTAEQEGKINRDQLINKLHTQPAKLLGINVGSDTKIEVDMNEYEIKNEDLKTKCGWSPFAGRRVVGKVKEVTVRGETAYKDGKILAQAGSGKIIS